MVELCEAGGRYVVVLTNRAPDDFRVDRVGSGERINRPTKRQGQPWE